MCLPAAAAIPLVIASSVVSAAGQVMQGQQAAAQGKYEAAVDRQNAGMEVDAAHQSILAGQDERRDFWRKVAQVKGQNIASMAANGIDVGYGSAARLQDDTQMLANDDAKNLYRGIEERTKGHLIDAGNYQSQAKAAKQRGKDALTNSYFGAASSVLGGLSQAAGMSAKMGKTG
jgi:hypothetical protein